MPDRITIPATFVTDPDATLEVEADEYGDSYKMTLIHGDGHIIAQADQFRPGMGQDFGVERAKLTAGTFGAFLAAALEDPEFGEKWDVLAEDADQWTDALAIMSDGE